MTVHSGRSANVNGVDTMRSWTIEERMAPAKATASNTRRGVQRKSGIWSWSGSINSYGAQPAAALLPGSALSFVGYGAPTDDVSGNGLVYSGTAYVNQLAITWNWKSGEMISNVANFVGHLALAKAAAADPGDTTVPDTPVVSGTKIQYKKVGGSFVDLANVTTATLTLTAAIQSYVNSSTYITDRVWTGQKPGAPMDWTLSIGQEDDERVAVGMFDVGDDLELKLFVDSTLFWQLVWGRVEGFGGITADRETGAILARTISIGMDCYYGTAIGNVTAPDSTVWFPPS